MSTPSYCTAILPTPLLNTSDYDNIFGTNPPPVDKLGLLRSVEGVALPGTRFTVHNKPSRFILEVSTQEYPNAPLYIDERFVKPAEKTAPEREKTLPPGSIILKRLKACLGLPYIWGGNWGLGIPLVAELYNPKIAHSHLHPALSFKGLDCSGLLYEATNGYPPRNTSDLLSFGNEVSSIENVKPLDILVWPGHVVIVLEDQLVIESRYKKGVILSSLKDHLSNDFVIRRFI